MRTKEYDVPCGIPPGFDGLRIAQISDLHGNERLYGALLRHTRDAGPDLIFLTGDITDAEEQWPKLEGLLKALTEIAPCYYVSGNHEWADLEPEPLFRRIADAGVRVLRNEWVLLERSGDRVALVGFEDPNGYADMIQARDLCELIRQSTDEFVIALCHRPNLFPELAEGGLRPGVFRPQPRRRHPSPLLRGPDPSRPEDRRVRRGPVLPGRQRHAGLPRPGGNERHPPLPEPAPALSGDFAPMELNYPARPDRTAPGFFSVGGRGGPLLHPHISGAIIFS